MMRDTGSYLSVGGLPAAVIAGLSLGASGFPFFGSDTGGYRNAPPDKETFTRWFEHTALSTVMQVGTNSNDVAWEFRENNGFDQEMLDWYRIYARLHLRLFPYEWTYAQRVLVDGRPILRAYGLQHPERGLHPSDVYFFGDDLLVAPVVRRGEREKEVPFPPGGWFDWWTGERYDGDETVVVEAPLGKLPLYLRAGGMVPLLRPTIDTLSPVEDAEAIESFHHEAGRLYVQMAVGPAHTFELYDGTRLSHTLGQQGEPTESESDLTASITVDDGDVFNAGMEFHIMGVSESPASIVMDGERLETNLDARALSGWRYEAETQQLFIRVGPGAHQLTW
jgi:alpha-D-xyloside xylohydrolase